MSNNNGRIMDETGDNGRHQYECTQCQTSYPSISSLEQHLLIGRHKKITRKTCDICGEIVSSMKKHLAVHAGELPDVLIPCDICGKRFSDRSRLKKHSLMHSVERPFECDICEKKFRRSFGLKEHKRIHTGEKPFKCDICGNKFNQSTRLTQHKRVHTGEKPFECDNCGKRFPRSGHLNKHLKTCRKMSNGIGPNSSNLYENEESEILSDILPQSESCSNFNEEFDANVNIKTELCVLNQNSLISNHYDPFRSNISADGEVSQNTIPPSSLQQKQDPLSKCTNKKMKRCDFCGESFHSGSFKRHLFIHTGEKPFECSMCGKKFRDSYCLRRHVLIHSGEKHLECDTCGKKFSDPANFTKHKRTHTGEKPFQCGICGKGFGDSSTWKRHIVTSCIPKNKKPIESNLEIKCDICGKSYKNVQELEWHKKIHSRSRVNKLLSCHFCGKKFGESRSLQLHVWAHSGEKPNTYKCDPYGQNFTDLDSLTRHARLATCKKNNPVNPNPVAARGNIQNEQDPLEGCDIHYVDEERGLNMDIVRDRTTSTDTDTSPGPASSCSIVEQHNTDKIHNSQNRDEQSQCDICGEWVENSGTLLVHHEMHMNEEHFKNEIEIKTEILS